jgi:hypothetical protein
MDRGVILHPSSTNKWGLRWTNRRGKKKRIELQVDIKHMSRNAMKFTTPPQVTDSLATKTEKEFFSFAHERALLIDLEQFHFELQR